MKKQCDLVVIGGGGSGLIAGCRAATLGKTVMVLEKDKRLGGGMVMASTMRTFGSQWQKERNLPDTTALYMRNRMDETYWRLDRKLVGGMLLYPVFMACFLPLQTLNKVFMYNCVGDKTYDNCWDFVAEGEHGLFMDIDSEIVGKNFLYMLTRDDYAAWLKESFEALSADEQAYFQPTIAEMESEAADLGLGADGAYALAWIKLWVESYNAQTDDGPICNTLVDASAKDQFGLLVYSKLRSVEESSSVSVNNIKVAAYEDGYQGIGGYGYCHYLFVTDNSPLPWTACAFIAYMTCTADGFSAWGKDMGGYSSNPTVAEETEANFHHSIGGMAEDGTTVEFAAKNDRGYEWWTTNGKLVLEDPEYCADVAFTVGSWIEMLSKYSAG